MEAPPKEVIFAELERMYSERGRRIGFKNHKYLEKWYMMVLIATMESDHQWFNKDWIYRPKKKVDLSEEDD